MNQRKFLCLIVIMVSFILTACTSPFSGIKKDVLMKDNIKSSIDKEISPKKAKAISQGQIKNIFLESLKKYYNLNLKDKINGEKLSINFADKDNIMMIVFKLGIDNYLKAILYEKNYIPQKGWYIVDWYDNKGTLCNAIIDAENGKVLSLSYFYLYKYNLLKMDENKIKEVSEKFIRDKNIGDINKLKLRSLKYKDNQAILSYSGKDNESIEVSISVDMTIKKVTSFSIGIQAYLKSGYDY